MPIKVACPNPDCKTEYQVPQDRLGKSAKCTKCGLKFTLQMSAEETVAPKSQGSSAAPPPSPPAPLPSTGEGRSAVELPAKIGPYQIKRLLGAGAMGHVYLAHDPHLDRDVALKVLPRELTDDEELGSRFLREARLTAKIQHPNTVVIHQVMVEAGLTTIVMELLDGGSLEDVVAKRSPLPWREATAAIRDAAAGLGAAHEMGLVHRDIKPANLMRTCKGTVKVVDFGLVRAIRSASPLTQRGTILGTPGFMAPEQWKGQEADARSDLYSLVCTYYFLLTGKEPFAVDSLPALGYKHCHEPFPDARKLVSDLPAAACRILARGTEKDPAQRFQTALELITALDELLAMSPKELTSDGAVDATAPAKPLEERPPRKRQPAIATGGLQQVWNKCRSAIPPRLRTRGWLTVLAAGLAGVLLLLGAIIYVVSQDGAMKVKPGGPAGKEITVDLGAGVKLEMVLIPAGEFVMGSPESDKDARDEEKPQHQVQIGKPFYMGRYLVTQEQWEAVMGNNPSAFKGPKNPVEFVSWDDAHAFLDRLNAKIGGHGDKFILPTEAQWEYACRAGNKSKYFFGEDAGRIAEYAWYSKNSGGKTHPVGEKKPNAWGLYDMHGNVWEWCQDWYDSGYYANSPPGDPPGPGMGSSHVIRGGDWNGDAGACRSALRGRYTPENRRNYLGFRMARVPADN